MSDVALAGLLLSARRGSDTLFNAMSPAVVATRIVADATSRLRELSTSTDSIVAVVKAHSRATAKTYSLGSTDDRSGTDPTAITSSCVEGRVKRVGRSSGTSHHDRFVAGDR